MMDEDEIGKVLSEHGVKRISREEISAEIAVLHAKCGSIMDATIKVLAKYEIDEEDAAHYLTEHLLAMLAKEAQEKNMAKGVYNDRLSVFKRRR